MVEPQRSKDRSPKGRDRIGLQLLLVLSLKIAASPVKKGKAGIRRQVLAEPPGRFSMCDLPPERAMRQGINVMEQLGEMDVFRVHLPPAHLHGGAAGKVGNLGIQRPHKIVSGDPAAGIDPAKCLIGKVPLPAQQTMGLANSGVKREMFKVL
jgi:hypothetical protein